MTTPFSTQHRSLRDNTADDLFELAGVEGGPAFYRSGEAKAIIWMYTAKLILILLSITTIPKGRCGDKVEFDTVDFVESQKSRPLYRFGPVPLATKSKGCIIVFLCH